MRQLLRSKPVRGLLGFGAGLALWLSLGPFYNGVVASFSEIGIRSLESPRVTALDLSGKDVVINRLDFDPRSPRPQVKVSDLTFNFVILVTLVAISGSLLDAKQASRYLLGFVVLFGVHVWALAMRVMAIYSLHLGKWSTVHYSKLERNIWGTADHFYRFVGLYAFAFAIWWWLKPRDVDAADVPAKTRGWKKKGR